MDNIEIAQATILLQTKIHVPFAELEKTIPDIEKKTAREILEMWNAAKEGVKK